MTGPVARVGHRWRQLDGDAQRFARVVAVAGLVSLVLFVAVLWGFRPDPLRTAYGDASFSNFYDVQAHQLLQGELDLPEGELGIEAFVIDGHEYMYFPPGPAILRMPLLALTDSLDGLLSGPSMLIAWSISTVLLGLLFWRVRRVLRPGAPLGRVEAIGYGVLLASTSAGSVVLFLASMPFVYHEAYLWAIATSLGAAFCILGFLERPRTSALVGASAFTLGAVLCRTTAGWACAGALVLAALWSAFRRPDAPPARWAPWAILAALLPLSVGVAFNWAKFRHPYMFPLEDQVWSTVNEQRRLALEANGGDLVSLKIFPSTAMAYLRPDGIRFTSLFPWITLPARPAASYGGSYLDQSYRTGSVVAFAPLLTGLSIWGLITTFRPGAGRGQRLLRIPALGVLAIPGAILFYGYIAYRYTSEIVPALALLGVTGLVDVARRLEGRPARARQGWLAALAVLAAFGFVANLAVAVGTTRINNPGPRLSELVRLQDRLSGITPGDPLDDLVHVAPTLPEAGAADEIQIVGDCTAAYVGTGDPLWPWMPLELRELGWDLDLSGWDRAPGHELDITLALPRDYPSDGIVLHLDGDTFRGTFDTGQEIDGRRARPIPEDGRLRLRLVSDLKLMQYVLVDIDNPRRGLVDIENSLPRSDWFRQQLIFDDQLPEETTVDGVTITPVPTAPLPLCEELRSRATPGPEAEPARAAHPLGWPTMLAPDRAARTRHVG